MQRIHQSEEAREGFMLDLDEIAREGARRMLAYALERPKSRRMSRRPQESGTSGVMHSSQETATPESARFSAEPGR